jgi:hypothetical protein
MVDKRSPQCRLVVSPSPCRFYAFRSKDQVHKLVGGNDPSSRQQVADVQVLTGYDPTAPTQSHADFVYQRVKGRGSGHSAQLSGPTERRLWVGSGP